MSKRWFEFTIGLYVEASTEQEAWEKIKPLVKLANTLDPEREAHVEMQHDWPVKGG